MANLLLYFHPYVLCESQATLPFYLFCLWSLSFSLSLSVSLFLCFSVFVFISLRLLKNKRELKRIKAPFVREPARNFFKEGGGDEGFLPEETSSEPSE